MAAASCQYIYIFSIQDDFFSSTAEHSFFEMENDYYWYSATSKRKWLIFIFIFCNKKKRMKWKKDLRLEKENGPMKEGKICVFAMNYWWIEYEISSVREGRKK